MLKEVFNELVDKFEELKYEESKKEDGNIDIYNVLDSYLVLEDCVDENAIKLHLRDTYLFETVSDSDCPNKCELDGKECDSENCKKVQYVHIINTMEERVQKIKKSAELVEQVLKELKDAKNG